VERADCDGFNIIENEPNTKVYIYYSEIDQLFQQIRKVRYDWLQEETNSAQHSPSSKKVSSNNTNIVNKSFVDSSYVEYMESDVWKHKRLLRLNFDGHRCVECGGRIGLQVHHKRYSSFGCEDVKRDLVTLCEGCHTKATGFVRRKRKGGVEFG